MNSDKELRVPYMASVSWYADWLAERLGWEVSLQDVDRRDLNRCKILGANGLQTLSVPIDGGGRNLRLPYKQIGVSEHGSWRRVHWGAIFSAYGRTPYFEHYEHLLSPIWAKPWISLAELNRAIHDVVVSIILTPEMESQLRKDISQACRVATDYSDYWQINRVKDGFVSDLSIMDLLFSLGPQAIFHLLHTLIDRGVNFQS